MTTDEAFDKLLHTRGIHKTIGIPANDLTNLRDRFKKGIGISLERKINLLQRAGFKMVQGIEWKASQI